jgi:hypothetical protein
MAEDKGINFSEFSDLADDGGYDVKLPVNPEDEFFHAVYISGQQRQNSLGVTEIPGKLQIRGLKANLDAIDFIIVHVKQVLVKSIQQQRGEKLECFSYQLGNPPWKSTTGNMCAKNAAERAANPFCVPCRSQLILAGIYLDPDTKKPFMMANGKPAYIFIRAKGTKYGNVATYLADLSKNEDLEPIVTPVTNESKEFERRQVNHKRFITRITVGKTQSAHGMKDVFELTSGAKLSVDAVKNMLMKQKETSDQFKEKFDWSKGKANVNDYSAAGASKVDEAQKFDFTDTTGTKAQKETTSKNETFNLDDITF